MAKRKSFSINQSLTQGLEETIHAAHDYSGELLVDVVPINRLELDPENPRELHLNFHDVTHGVDSADPEFGIKQQELERLQTLANSIKNQGLINPVVVYKHRDKYRLIAGERRTLASLLSGKKNIQARILDKRPDSLRRTILQWMENIEREDLTLAERLTNINAIMQAYAAAEDKRMERITAVELSELIGISTSQAAQYKAVLQGSDELLAAINANQVKNLDKAALIAKAPMNKQNMLLTLTAQGANLKEMKQAIDSVAIVANPKSKPAGFKVAIENEKVVQAIIETMLNHQEFGHLKTQFAGHRELKSKKLSKLFQKFVKSIEEFV